MEFCHDEIFGPYKGKYQGVIKKTQNFGYF